MKLLTVLAATAVAAAVAAALAITAGADSGAGDRATKIAACERSNPVTACEPRPTAPTGLVACLRAHRLDPPSDVRQLKPWLLRQGGTAAGKAALSACGIDFDPPPAAKSELAPCGGAAEKPRGGR